MANEDAIRHTWPQAANLEKHMRSLGSERKGREYAGNWAGRISHGRRDIAGPH